LYRTKYRTHSPIEDLHDGVAVRKLDENFSYGLAGLVIDAIVTKVGWDGLRDHLYGATQATWTHACEATGTTAAALNAAFDQGQSPQ
jgi:hypothetical protein